MVGDENVLKQKHKLPVDVHGSKTSLLKLPITKFRSICYIMVIEPSGVQFGLKLRVISKSNSRKITSMISDHNCTTRSLITILFNLFPSRFARNSGTRNDSAKRKTMRYVTLKLIKEKYKGTLGYNFYLGREV